MQALFRLQQCRLLSGSTKARTFTASSHMQENIRLKTSDDIQHFFANPTWSVAALLPTSSSTTDAPEISSKQLHHLLRLSALPPPRDAAEEEQMLKTLASQLHFVKEIQNADTTAVKPLYSLRDETHAGRQEATLGLEELKEALAQEEVIGKHHKRIRRKLRPADERRHEQWDVLGTAEKKIGRYFVVEGDKD